MGLMKCKILPPSPTSLFQISSVTSEMSNQMQTRMDAEIVVYSKLSRKPGYQKYAVQNRKAKGYSITNAIKIKNQNFRLNRQGLGRIRIVKQRGVLYNSSVNWLTQMGTE